MKPRGIDQINQALQILVDNGIEVRPCEHEFITVTTGARWFDGEPEDTLEDHTICKLCGHEEVEDQNE